MVWPKCRTPESPPRALEPCRPVSSQMGVPLKHGKLSTLAHPLLHFWTRSYHTSPVDDSCFLTLTLCWIGRLHTNPIRSRVHTPPVPSGSRRPREALAKDLLSTTPRAAVDIEDADTVDGEVVTERTVPVPKLGLPPKLAPGPSRKAEIFRNSTHWILTLNKEGAQQSLHQRPDFAQAEKRMQEIARPTLGKDSTRLQNHSSQPTSKTEKRTSV